MIFHNKFIDKPIFIVGHGRSGTTIVQRSLMAHPKIIGTSFESPMVARIAGLRELFHYQDQDKIKYYQDSTHISAASLDAALRKLIFESVFGDGWGYRRLFWELRKRKLKYFRLNSWVAKVFPSEQTFGMLNALFPNAKYIYVVRNGRDVITSGLKKDWFKKKSFTQLCDSWVGATSFYDYLRIQASSGSGNVFQLKYEDFKDNPEDSLEKVIKFLELNRSEKPVDYVRRNIIGSQGKPNLIVDNSTEYFKKVNAHTNEWSEEQHRIFSEKCTCAMRKYGYT